MTPIEPEVSAFLRDFFDANVAAPFREQGVVVHLAARDLFVLTVHAQIDAGIIRKDKVAAAVEAIMRPDITNFYRLKFGGRPLSYNRMLRLLADMHDMWILNHNRSARFPIDSP